jgi:hypothetical protein
MAILDEDMAALPRDAKETPQIARFLGKNERDRDA